jgi:hypothetical protein
MPPALLGQLGRLHKRTKPEEWRSIYSDSEEARATRDTRLQHRHFEQSEGKYRPRDPKGGRCDSRL